VHVHTYTTCASCGGSLAVRQPGHDTHRDCPPATDIVHTRQRDYLAAVVAGDQAAANHAEHLLDSLDPDPPRLLDAALAYVAWGWPVFPCRPWAKTPALSRKDGGHGLHDATLDPEQIRDWWWRWPLANIGVATGHAFDVVDVDPDGLDWWARVRDQDGLPDCHGQVSTPRAGLHVYITRMGGGNLAGLADGIDYRGLGGYVVLPPSVLSPAAYRTRPVNRTLTYTWISYPSPAIRSASVPS
jgi:hypothetical protein